MYGSYSAMPHAATCSQSGLTGGSRRRAGPRTRRRCSAIVAAPHLDDPQRARRSARQITGQSRAGGGDAG